GPERMQSPGANAAGKGCGDVNLNDRCAQNLPTRARHLRNMAILVGNRSSGAKNHAIDWLVAQIPGLIDRRFLRQQFLGADHVRCHDIMILNVGGTLVSPPRRELHLKLKGKGTLASECASRPPARGSKTFPTLWRLVLRLDWGGYHAVKNCF